MILSEFIILFSVFQVHAVKLDIIECGIDHNPEVDEGDVKISQYPWLGILYYSYDGEGGESRAVTTVALIQREFVIAPAADIGPMPKRNFRANSRVLLGVDWGVSERRVRNYVIHPEYGETFNTIALVQLGTPVRNPNIRPLCPPPERVRSPDFYVVKFDEDYNKLQKQVIPVTHVPSSLCRDFYIRTNLYAKQMRPPHVACAVSRSRAAAAVCVWRAGGALVVRDLWGRWQLLGMLVRGPGCGAPSRYLDMMSYFPWIEDSLAKFQRISITKISNHKYVLRTSHTMTKFGNCDDEEKVNLVYREQIHLRTDNNLFQFLTYNLTLREDVEFSCLTIELINATAVSEMRIRHQCSRSSYGPPCYAFKRSIFDISVFLIFSETCFFEMIAWGWRKNMTLLDIHEWKWEEGTYYEDFTMTPVEYRGPSVETDYGFEPLDVSMWVPEYDVWSTTEYDNSTTEGPYGDLGDNDTPPPASYWAGFWAMLPQFDESWRKYTPKTVKPQWIHRMSAIPHENRFDYNYTNPEGENEE